MLETFRSHRLTVLSVIAVLTIVLSTLLLLTQLRARELEHAVGETISLSGIISEQTTRSLQSVDMALRIALTRLEEAERQGISLDDAAIHAMLQSRVASMPHLLALFIVDADGNSVNTSRAFPTPPTQVADREYFRRHKEGKGVDLHVGAPVMGRTTHTWTLHISRRIQKLNGEFGGVVAAALDLSYFENLYGSVKLDFVSPISLHMDDGTLVVRQPHDAALIGKKLPLPDVHLHGAPHVDPVTIRNEGDDPGSTTFRHISEFPLVLAVGNSDKAALTGWRESARIIVADASLAAILVLLAAYLLLREQHRAEQQARESHQQLRELAASLQTIREEERTSIARELHDELGQQLLRLRMDLSWLSGRVKDLSAPLHEKVLGMKQFIESTVDTVRRVTTRLRPPVLDDLGLAEAMRWQMAEFEKNTGIAVTASFDVDSAALEQKVATHLFRILQEALTNIARHAEATQVEVTFAQTGTELQLQIHDNGHGAKVGADRTAGSHGLVGIRERVLMLGGQMEIISAPESGFTLNVRISIQPLATPEASGEQN
jgi:signal transduction histidine kinase/predicted nucleic acid-binding protein